MGGQIAAALISEHTIFFARGLYEAGAFNRSPAFFICKNRLSKSAQCPEEMAAHPSSASGGDTIKEIMVLSAEDIRLLPRLDYSRSSI